MVAALIVLPAILLANPIEADVNDALIDFSDNADATPLLFIGEYDADGAGEGLSDLELRHRRPYGHHYRPGDKFIDFVYH